MSMKKYFAFVLIMCIFTVPSVFADGCMVSDSYLHLNEPYQKAVIVWDRETGTETMVLSAAVKSRDIGNFAWIVPIQSCEKPEVYESNITVFEHLVDYFAVYPRYKSLVLGMEAVPTVDSGVVVIESKELDVYDITILQATDSTDLIDWLNENGYQIPDEAENMFQRYINKGDYYFIANKIDLSNKYAEEIEEIEDLYARFGGKDESATSTIYDKIYYIERQSTSYAGRNKYADLKTTVRDLQSGIGTPIKFVFKPKEMYFPLEITSLNSGYTKIEVYVISNAPVIDKNEILNHDKTKQMSTALKKKLQDELDVQSINCDYVTRLTYYDDVKYLREDAVFQDDQSKIIDIVIDKLQNVWGIGWMFRMFG